LVAIGMTIGWLGALTAVAIMALGSALQAAVGIGLALFVVPVLALIDLGSVAALVAVGLFGWSELTRAVILLPGVGMGLVAAPYIAPFINRSRLKWAILIVSSVSAVTLLVR
jgi:hypothetical protein